MNLLSSKTFEDDNVKKITNLLKEYLMNIQNKKSNSFSNLVTYQEFKDEIYNFINSIMHIFLNNNGFNTDKYTVIIKDLPKKNKGFFLDSEEYDNLLVIDEEVIKSIYDGHIEDLLIIFHELNHFKVKYDIKSGVINENIVRIIKEKLIRTSKDIYSFSSLDSNDYYYDNYNVYSEEVYVSLQAKKSFLYMLKSLTNNKLIQLEFTKLFAEEYKYEISKDTKRYNNHLRDLSSRSDFNDYYLNFEAAFDLLVVDNPNWLDYPQISIEYYIDENNRVQKRTIKELEEQLKQSTNPEEIAYINYLINKTNSKKSIKK